MAETYDVAEVVMALFICYDMYYNDVYYSDVYYDDVYYDDVYYSDVYYSDVYYDDVYYDDVYMTMCTMCIIYYSCRVHSLRNQTSPNP